MIDLEHNTNTVGIFVLFVAAVSAASVRQKNWLVLAVILAGMTVAIATRAHWILHDAIREWLVGAGLYADHFPVQAAITGIAAFAFASAGLWIGQAQQGTLRWASLATTALLALFLLQAISIHAVDALLGHAIGPVMLVAWLWITGAVTIALAALVTRRRTSLRP